MILCILHPPPILRTTATVGAQCRDPIPFILLPLSTVYFRQQQWSRFIDRTRTYTLTKPGYIRGLLRNRIFVARDGRKISEYLERFRLNSTKYPRIFRRSLWIFRSCYWHTLRWNLFTTSLMATLSCLS